MWASLRQRSLAWFFRRQQPEPGIITLDRRRVYIVPTGGGLLFAIVLITMYIGAINYNLGLGHALVFLLIGLGWVGMLQTWRNLVDLSIAPGKASPVFCGETAGFSLHLINRRAEARGELISRKTDTLAAEGIANGIAAHSDCELQIPCHTVRRGRLVLPRLRIETRYPLGLFVAWSYPWPDAQTLVYPRPIYRPLPTPSASETKDGPLEHRGNADFAGLRAYQPGDSLRHVAWKAYARQAEHLPPQVKHFAGAAPGELWLRWDALPAPMDEEDRLSILCGWVLQANEQGIRYGLRLLQKTFPPDIGPGHCQRCLEALALYGFE